MLQQIIIDNIPYSISVVGDLKSDEGDPLMGHVFMYKKQILIDGDTDPEVQIVVLLHEALHAILYQRGFRLEDELEESLVTSLAYAVYNLFKKNPDLIALINPA